MLLQIFQVWLADRKNRWRQQQQKGWDGHELPDKEESEQRKRMWDMEDKVRDSQMLLSRRLQPEIVRSIGVVRIL